MEGLFQLLQVKGVGISRNWLPAHFVVSDAWPQKCPGAGGSVICLLMYFKQPLLTLPRWLSGSTKQETQVCSLGWEDPLEEEIATDSSILA